MPATDTEQKLDAARAAGRSTPERLAYMREYNAKRGQDPKYRAEEAIRHRKGHERRRGSGEIAVRCAFPMSEVGPGPVPDDAKGITGRRCPICNGTGTVQADPNDEIEEWMR